MSTSKLQCRVSELLSTYLGHWTIRENYRPEWLNSLELDFYLEEIEAAIEVQGGQHYQFVEWFHRSYDGFRAQLNRDERKRELCADNGVILYAITNEDEAITIIERLSGVQIEHCTHPNALRQEQQWKEEAQWMSLVGLASLKPIKGWIKKLQRARRLISESKPGADVDGFFRCIKKREDAIRRHLVRNRYDSTLIDGFMADYESITDLLK